MNADEFYPGSYVDDDGKRVFFYHEHWSLEAYRRHSGDEDATVQEIRQAQDAAAQARGR